MATWTGIFEISVEVEAETEEEATKKCDDLIVKMIQSGETGCEPVFPNEEEKE